MTRCTHGPVQRKPPSVLHRDAPPCCLTGIRGCRLHIGGRQSSRPDTSPWLDHGLSLCSAPRHGVRASSNRPGAASFGCKTCHCARRRPHISHWTSQAAAADLSSLCARRVPTLALDRAKSQPKPGSVNQPAGWTGNSTARSSGVWRGACDDLDCEEQQHVELSATTTTLD